MKSGESQTKNKSRKAYEEAKKQKQEEESIQVSEEYEQEVEDEETAEELEELAETSAGQKEQSETSELEEQVAENMDTTKARIKGHTQAALDQLRPGIENLQTQAAREKVEEIAEEGEAEALEPSDVVIELPDDAKESVETFTEQTAEIAEEQDQETEGFLESFKEKAKKPFSVLGDAFDSGKTTIEKGRKNNQEDTSRITEFGKTAIDKVAGFLESNEPAKWFTKEEYTLPGGLSSEEQEAAAAEEERLNEQQKKFENITDEWLEEASVYELEIMEEMGSVFDDLQESLQNVLENPSKYKTPAEKVQEITDQWLMENRKDLDDREKRALTNFHDKIQNNLQNIFESEEYTTPEEGEEELTPAEKRRAAAEEKRIQAQQEEYEEITNEWIESAE